MKKDLKRTTWNTLVLALVLVGALFLYAAVSMGWFTNNREVSGGGLGALLRKPRTLHLHLDETSKVDIQDIFVEGDHYAADYPLALYANGSFTTGDDSVVGPGSFGRVTAYVEADPEDDTETYTLQVMAQAVANSCLNDASDPEDLITNGWYEGRMPEGEQTNIKRKAQAYMDTHIAFFTDCDPVSHQLSGWLEPGKRGSFAVDETQLAFILDGDEVTTDLENKEITLYWAWIHDYSCFQAGTLDPVTPIAAEDRTRIRDHAQEHAEEWYFNNESADSYNYADMFIATYVADIRVQLEFSA